MGRSESLGVSLVLVSLRRKARGEFLRCLQRSGTKALVIKMPVDNGHDDRARRSKRDAFLGIRYKVDAQTIQAGMIRLKSLPQVRCATVVCLKIFFPGEPFLADESIVVSQFTESFSYLWTSAPHLKGKNPFRKKQVRLSLPSLCEELCEFVRVCLHVVSQDL
jgi:hypothetical protein